MITTGNKDLYEKLLAARFYGQKDRVICSMFGVNSRLDELQAAILNTKLKYLDKWNKKRAEIADLYRRLIKNSAVVLPSAQDVRKHVYHLFVVRTKKRDALIKILAKQGIQTMIHYPVLLHRQPFFKKGRMGFFPNAQILNREILSLPLYPFIKKSEVETIARIINQAKL